MMITNDRMRLKIEIYCMIKKIKFKFKYGDDEKFLIFKWHAAMLCCTTKMKKLKIKTPLSFKIGPSLVKNLSMVQKTFQEFAWVKLNFCK